MSFNCQIRDPRADLVRLVSDVTTALGEAFRGCPRLHRDLKRSLAIMVAEIQAGDGLLAISESYRLRNSFRKMAGKLEGAFRKDFVSEKYSQLGKDQSQQSWGGGFNFSLLPSWLAKSAAESKAKNDARKGSHTQHECLEMLRDVLQSPLRRNLRIVDLLIDNQDIIKDLTASVTDFNDLMEQLDSGQFEEDDEHLMGKGHPKPIISEAAIRGDSSIRRQAQALYNTLHENWPCRLGGHEHSGKLGCCVEAKFCLDPQWCSRDPDLLRDSFFLMLAGTDVMQECRVGMHPISVANGTNTLACLVDSEDSKAVCLRLAIDDDNRLWGQRLGQPLEVLQLEDEHSERSLETLGNLLEIVKPTFAAKRVLGVILARSLLHLLEGPWIKWSLSINDISLLCTLKNNRPYPSFDKVFLSTIFRVHDSQWNSQEGGRSPYSIHPFPTILALGIVLAEIELGDELREIYSQPSFAELRKKPSALAKRLWKECQHRFHLETGLMRAVKYCVERTSFLPFANMNGETLLADSTFVSTYYMNAVRPLEEDLVDGAKWTWDEVNWLQRRNLDDHGVCKIITKLENDLLGDQDISPPGKFQRHKRPPASASTLTTIDETISQGPNIPESNSQRNNFPELLRPDDFEVAIICALPLEANAVLSAFDRLWDLSATYAFRKAVKDPNFYSVGVMGGRNVILAHPPHPGKATAATTAAACAMSFKNIKLALVVGVCGAVPFKQNSEEILLGDVIISKGVIQYDNGRQFSDSFSRKIDVEASLGRPNARVGSFMAALETPYYRSSIQTKINYFLEDMDTRGAPNCYPGSAEDKLYESSYRHKHHDTNTLRCKVCTMCQQDDDPVCDEAIHLSCRGTGCEDTKLVQRSRQNQKHRPMPHIGLIASGDSVIKSSAHRDQLARKENVIAFEMEGAGVWDAMPCVIIKGACDYADSHKNKLWQEYAATTAAACAKAFIQYW
ncbi:hypothetical protein BDW69DRAFT_89322 [Aspergillus filifer]